MANLLFLSLSIWLFQTSGLIRNIPIRLKNQRIESTTWNSKDDDSNGDKKELLRELDNSFEYEGRLPMRDNFRCGFVSILGAPNMGKSTLLNALLKEDLCIATRRPQTTRHAILGVLTTADTQLCLIDTPGIIDNPAYKLQEGMMEAVMTAFYDSDVLMIVTDLYSTPIPDDEIFEKVKRSRVPVVVVINKIDLVGQAIRNAEETEDEGRTYTVPEAVAKWRSLLPVAVAIIPVAASEGPENEGVNLLRTLLLGGKDVSAAIRKLGRPVPGMFQEGVQFISDDQAKSLLPPGPPLYDEEILTDRSERYVVKTVSKWAWEILSQ